MNKTGTISDSWAFRLIIINVAVYLSQEFLFLGESKGLITHYFALYPILVKEGFIWQLFSYMFLHGNWMHIFFNMYALLLFGVPIEEVWGSKKFIIYYIFTGIGAGLSIFILNLILGGEALLIPTIGASGAVFGILLAFGILFPNSQILLFFVVPIKAKYLVILYGGIEIYSMINTMGSSPISHIGHLGGLFFGIVYFLFTRRHEIRFKSSKLKSKYFKEIKNRDINAKENISGSSMSLLQILNKVKTSGAQSLTDDEYQNIKLLSIIKDRANTCIDDDFNIEDDYCAKCEDYEACIIKAINKYI